MAVGSLLGYGGDDGIDDVLSKVFGEWGVAVE
jgi:hypothetical protein